jgi:hypothetical protein
MSARWQIKEVRRQGHTQNGAQPRDVELGVGREEVYNGWEKTWKRNEDGNGKRSRREGMGLTGEENYHRLSYRREETTGLTERKLW